MDPTEEAPEASARLVYGEYWMHDGFAILNQTVAEGLATEIAAIKACTTVGAVRRLEPTLEFTWVPGSELEDDDGEPIRDDAAYDWSSLPEVGEGDWPPMPDAYALDGLPEELLEELIAQAGGKVVDTRLNGPYFAIPLEREEDMLTVPRSSGYEARRDDGLIYSIGAAQ